MKNLKSIFYMAILIAATISCSDDKDDPKEPVGAYSNGIFIANEGPFNNGSGTLTFVGDDGMVEQKVYKTVNNEDLGNIVNSIYISDEVAYIVVNNSHKLVLANANTMEMVGEFIGEDIKNPRYFIKNVNTGYVSNWGDPTNPDDDFITVIDLRSNEIISTIAVGEGPENMAISNGKLFVNLEGGYSQNNKVAVINLSNNTLTETLTVGDVPNSITSDGNGNVWVLCGGIPAWTGNETSGKLVKIKAGDLSAAEVAFGDSSNPMHPQSLGLDQGNLYYYLNGKVYTMDASDTTLPTEAMEGLDGYYYNMVVANGQIFTLDAGDFASEGVVKWFDATTGALMQTIDAGIIPTDIAVN